MTHKPTKLNNMFKKILPEKTGLKINNSYKGERIETKVLRILTNGEPIKDQAPLIYTDRKDGAQPAYDIRTDKWDAALDGMTIASQTHNARREQSIGERTYDTMKPDQQKEFNAKFPKNKHALAAAKQDGTAGSNTATS